MPVIGMLFDFLSVGGKRLRPLLLCCGSYAVGSMGESGTMLRAAASLELFHAFVLIHDDISTRAALATVRDIFVETGALATVEAMIRRRRQQDVAALDRAPFRPGAPAALREIAHPATMRAS